MHRAEVVPTEHPAIVRALRGAATTGKAVELAGATQIGLVPDGGAPLIWLMLTFCVPLGAPDVTGNGLLASTGTQLRSLVVTQSRCSPCAKTGEAEANSRMTNTRSRLIIITMSEWVAPGSRGGTAGRAITPLAKGRKDYLAACSSDYWTAPPV